MRYCLFPLLASLLFFGSFGTVAAIPAATRNQAQDASANTGRGASTAITRAARSGPVFGLAALAAISVTRTARNPAPIVFESAEQTPIAAVSAVNTLLSTARSTAVSASLLPVVSPRYAAALNSAYNPAVFSKTSAAAHATSGSAVQKLIKEGWRYIGVPYRWGGSSPITGMDCSGLVQVVFRDALGIDLPRTSLAMATQGDRVNVRDLKPGDLVFFNTMGTTISHVGIYVGSSRFLHAPSTGNFVRIDKLNSAYWGQRYITARRLIGDARQNTQLASRALPASASSALIQ
ncbi:MAG: C40 family peptidase [Azoarcus sp.]|nr:C40 family peptidase [Azoarcus sp.]